MFIVKVQVSIASSDNTTHVLIYNEDRSIEYEQIITEDMKLNSKAQHPILKAMDDELKKFFYARVTKDKKIELLREADYQAW